MPDITQDGAVNLLAKLAPGLIEWLGACPCSCEACIALRELVRKNWPKSTPAEQEEQRRSFAYGNVALHNPAITRDMVNQAADELAKRTK